MSNKYPKAIISNAIVSKELAAAIEYLRELGWTNAQICRVTLGGVGTGAINLPTGAVPHIRVLESVKDDENLVKALYIGYELKKSLEEAFEHLAQERELWDGGDFAAGVHATLQLIAQYDGHYAHLSAWAENDFGGAVGLIPPEDMSKRFSITHHAVTREVEVRMGPSGPEGNGGELVGFFNIAPLFGGPFTPEKFWTPENRQAVWSLALAKGFLK